jgi:hypothetical protein
MPESLEDLLPLLVLALLALVERAVRAARLRRARALERDARDRPPAERPAMRQTRPSPPPVPAAVTPPLPTRARLRSPGAKTTSEEVRARDAAREAPALKRAVGRARPRPRPARLGGAFDLHGAIVLMTIVGPCRGISPYADPNDADRS